MFAALDAKYTKELADAKAENDALRIDIAAGRRLVAHQSSLSIEMREATTASGVDNAASPDWRTERDYFTLREADHYAKTTGRDKYINEQCR